MTDKLPPLPEMLERAIANFAQACLYSDVNARRASSEQLKGQIQDYARQAVREAAAFEREACAKVCDSFAESSRYKTQRNLAIWCAKTIRDRTMIAAAKEAK